MEATVRPPGARAIFAPALAGIRIYWPAFVLIQLINSAWCLLMVFIARRQVGE